MAAPQDGEPLFQDVKADAMEESKPPLLEDPSSSTSTPAAPVPINLSQIPPGSRLVVRTRDGRMVNVVVRRRVRMPPSASLPLSTFPSVSRVHPPSTSTLEPAHRNPPSIVKRVVQPPQGDGVADYATPSSPSIWPADQPDLMTSQRHHLTNPVVARPQGGSVSSGSECGTKTPKPDPAEDEQESGSGVGGPTAQPPPKHLEEHSDSPQPSLPTTSRLFVPPKMNVHPFLRFHYGGTAFVCDFCLCKFPKREFADHVLIHTTMGTFACPKLRCVKRFSKLAQLEAHLKRHWPDADYTKEPKKADESNARPFYRTHYLSEQLLCDQCAHSVPAEQFEEFAAHVHLHSVTDAQGGDGPFACPVFHCQCRFTDLDDLLSHTCPLRKTNGSQLIDDLEPLIYDDDVHPTLRRNYLSPPYACDVEMYLGGASHASYRCPQKDCAMRFVTLRETVAHCCVHWPMREWQWRGEAGLDRYSKTHYERAYLPRLFRAAHRPFALPPSLCSLLDQSHPLVRERYARPFLHCDVCDYETNNIYNLAAHLYRDHFVQRPFGCPLDNCYHRYTLFRDLLVHCFEHWPLSVQGREWDVQGRGDSPVQLVARKRPQLSSVALPPLARDQPALSRYSLSDERPRPASHLARRPPPLFQAKSEDAERGPPLQLNMEEVGSSYANAMEVKEELTEWLAQHVQECSPFDSGLTEVYAWLRGKSTLDSCGLPSSLHRFCHPLIRRYYFGARIGCDLCGEKSNNWHAFTRHLVVCHGVTRPFACPMQGCCERRSTLIALLKHCSAHWPQGEWHEELAASYDVDVAEKPLPPATGVAKVKQRRKEKLQPQEESYEELGVSYAVDGTEEFVPVKRRRKEKPQEEEKPMTRAEIRAMFRDVEEMWKETLPASTRAFVHPQVRSSYLLSYKWCDLCDVKCVGVGKLRRHMQLVHSESRPFVCPLGQCPTRCSTLCDVIMHSIQHWPTFQWNKAAVVEVEVEEMGEEEEEEEGKRAVHKFDKHQYEQLSMEPLFPDTEFYFKDGLYCYQCTQFCGTYEDLCGHMSSCHGREKARVQCEKCAANPMQTLGELRIHYELAHNSSWTVEFEAHEHIYENMNPNAELVGEEKYRELIKERLYPHSQLYFKDGLFCCDCAAFFETFDEVGRISRSLDLSFQLKKHSASAHEEVAALRCEGCGVRKRTMNDLSLHYMTTHKNSVVEWSRAKNGQVTQRKRAELDEHPLIPNTKLYFAKGLICYVCDKLYDDMDTLRVHFSQHHERERPLRCETLKCQARYDDLDTLRVHTTTAHLELEPDSCDFTCIVDGCNRTFSSRLTLNAHEFECKRINNWTEEVECDKCGRVLPNAIARQHHRIGCVGKKQGRFECPGCDRTYAQKQAMTNHMLQEHPGLWEQHIYKFQCPQCPAEHPMRFRWMNKLREHCATNHPDFPFFVCSCGKRFLAASEFEFHRKKSDRRHISFAHEEYAAQRWSRKEEKEEEKEEEADGSERGEPLEEVEEKPEPLEQVPSKNRRSSRVMESNKRRKQNVVEEKEEGDEEMKEEKATPSRRSRRVAKKKKAVDEEMIDHPDDVEEEEEKAEEEDNGESGSSEDEEEPDEAPVKKQKPVGGARRGGASRGQGQHLDSSQYSMGFTKQELGSQSNEEVRAILAEGVSLDCRFCDHTAENYLVLNEHYRTTHPDHPKPFRCPCGKTFALHQALPRHQRMQHWRLKTAAPPAN